jgi:hypothetical protein
MLKEIRVPIIGYEGLYEISNYGNVYGLDRYVRNSETTYRLVKGKKLEPQKNTLRDNYLQIGLSKNNHTHTYRLHVLVAKHFIPNTNNLSQINHIDGNKSNNRIDNLEWSAPLMNSRHAWQMGLANVNHLKRKVRCCNNNTIYESLNEAGRQLNLDSIEIGRVCMGRYKRVKGYSFEYAEEDKYETRTKQSTKI